jgi:sigma-E factor negative regulatory protein RseA
MSPHPDSHADDPPGAEGRRWLSAAADGDADAVGIACRAWREEPSARATWHAYHLIGDVLRSSDLAARPADDAAFLAGLRQRLAAEPVVLAPAQVGAARRSLTVWRMPAAVAAGIVVVAGVLVLSRVQPGPTQAIESMAAASGSAGITQVASGGLAVQPQGEQGLIRDARLDEYLRAHQAARGGMAVAVPGSALRRVDAELPMGVPR